MRHELKLQEAFYCSVVAGLKTFEIRFNDRDFKEGDILVLKEWDVVQECYTGREVEKEVTYITNFEQKKGYVVMSIK